ncbi:MAG TPA: cupin domain-containing protein [Bacteroidales bacterium]|nr:cupin domain-containing protein [Bacteroidales bacterium]
MEIKNIKDIKNISTNFEAKQIYQNKSTEVIILTLAPGESIKKHTNLSTIFFHILEGNGNIRINDKLFKVKHGDFFTLSHKDEREWINNTNDKLVILIIKELNFN